MRFLLYALLLAVAAFAFTNVEENTADAPDGAASAVAVQAEMPVLAAKALAAVDHSAYIEAAPLLADPATTGHRTTAGTDTRLKLSSQSYYCSFAEPVNYAQATDYGRAYHLLCHQGRLRSTVLNVASLRPLETGIKKEGRAHAPSIALALSPRRVV